MVQILRIGKESELFTFPEAAEPLISAFSVAFSARTFQRVAVLILGVILSLRRAGPDPLGLRSRPAGHAP